MRTLLGCLLGLIFIACTKDPRKAQVVFSAYCNGCAVECTTSDATMERANVVGTFTFAATADEGTSVTLRVEPARITDTAATIWIKIDGEEKGFTWVHPTTAGQLVPVEITAEVGDGL